MKQRMLSTGAVVLHQGADGCRYLLLRCYRNWDFPKGLLEPGEAPFAAACREVAEETSLTALAFPWGRQCAATAPYGAGKVARYYRALSASDDVRLPGQRVLPVLDWAQALSGCHDDSPVRGGGVNDYGRGAIDCATSKGRANFTPIA